MENKEKLLESIDNKIDENKKIRNIVITSWAFSISSMILQKSCIPGMALSLPSVLSFGAAISISVANIMIVNKNRELKNQLETANSKKQVKEINGEVRDNVKIKNFVSTSWALSLSKGLLQYQLPTSLALTLGFFAATAASSAWMKIDNKNKKLEEQYEDIENSNQKKLVK